MAPQPDQPTCNPAGLTYNFSVSDVDAEFQSLAASGLAAIMPLEDHPWVTAVLPFKTRTASFSTFTLSANPALSSSSTSKPDAMSNDRISKLLDDLRLLESGRFELVQALREIILGLDASISEEVKYGGILFSAEKPFCGVFSYAKHVSLEFGDGASLPDKFSVLEGEGKLRRHIKLAAPQDITGKHVREYLLMALKASRK